MHHILDEIVQGGLVLETNMNSVLRAVDDMGRLERASSATNSPVAQDGATLVAAGAATVTALAASATATALDRAQLWWRTGSASR